MMRREVGEGIRLHRSTGDPHLWSDVCAVPVASRAARPIICLNEGSISVRLSQATQRRITHFEINTVGSHHAMLSPPDHDARMGKHCSKHSCAKRSKSSWCFALAAYRVLEAEVHNMLGNALHNDVA